MKLIIPEITATSTAAVIDINSKIDEPEINGNFVIDEKRMKIIFATTHAMITDTDIVNAFLVNGIFLLADSI